MSATRKIMLIRHGEKPAVPPPPQGIDENGNLDPASMTAEGWKRARLLVSLFDPKDSRFRPGLARPTALFAGKIDDDRGKRPMETITPLAKALHLSIDQSYSGSKIITQVSPKPVAGGFALAIGYGESRIPELVRAIKTTGGSVLAAWRRGDLPTIGGLIAPSAAVPGHWPGQRYDVVWVFDLNDDNTTYRFSQVPQLLLPGDLAAPI
jgi:hypothetical protein